MDKFWWLGVLTRAIVTLAILALFSDRYRASCKKVWPFVVDNGLLHVLLAYIVLAVLLTLISSIWFVRRLKQGRGLDSVTLISLGLAFLGIASSIIPSLSSDAFRNQLIASLKFLFDKPFWQHHLITIGVFIVIISLWGPLLILLIARITGRYPLLDAFFRASYRHESHLEDVVARSLGPNTSPLNLNLITTVINSYSSSASKLVQYGSKAPLLPGNFDIYAQCVKGILDFLSDTDQIEYVSIFTLLKRPIWSWYNPLSTKIDGGNGVGEAVFTRDWWEKYKIRVAALKDEQRDPGKLRMKRLILQQSSNGSMNNEVPQRFFVLTNGRAKKHVNSLPLADLPTFATVKGGPDMHLLPEIERMATAHRDFWPEAAQLHLIGEYAATIEGAIPSPRQWTGLIGHFEDSYHSKSVKIEKASSGNPGGIFYGYIKTIERDFRWYARNYEDLFLVKLKPKKEDSFELFGIAFIDDKTGDEVGIRFLTSDEVSRMGSAFEKQWSYEGTVDTFCFCEERVI